VNTSFVGRLQLEDLALFGWTALVWPLFHGAFPNEFGTGSMFDDGHPIRGLVWTLAVACAFLVIVSHDAAGADEAPRQHVALTDGDPEARFAVFGPLVGGMGFIGAGGLAGLGLDRDLGFTAVFLGVPILVAMSRLRISPGLAHSTRRWLLTPLLLVGAALFNDFARSIGLGPDLLHDALGQASSAGLGIVDTFVSVSLGLSLFVLAAALFYTMLVAVPRQLIESDGGLGRWTLRFAVFVAGSLTGIGLLSGFGY
jgi:hypothetical protein